MSTQTCKCSHCGFAIAFLDNLAGTNGFCPSCGQQVLLQSAVTTAASKPAAPAATPALLEAPDVSKPAAPAATPSSMGGEDSAAYLQRIRGNTCYESARTAVEVGSYILYLAGGGIVFTGCYYGGNNGGGTAVAVSGWAIIALAKGGKHLILAILDIADIQIEVNRRK